MHGGLKTKRIPVAGPWITEKELAYVQDAAANAWYENANVYHERFEKAFAGHLRRTYAIALPSCTSAIHLALLGLKITAGDEIIVPDITWIASAAPIDYVGATPVFADVDETTWCIDPSSVEKLIGPRTKAVIAVDLYGNLADWAALEKLCRARGIALIEDAAQAVGASCFGRPAGGFGDASVFSFHGTKTLTTGEGGLLATDNEELYRRCLFLRDHGRASGEKMFWNSEVAYKYKMSAMQAALGLAQLERLPELIARKRAIFDWYRQELSGAPGLSLNRPAPRTDASYWMVTAVWKGGPSKEEVIRRLSAEGIDARPFFYPLSSMPAYENLFSARAAREANKTAYALSPFGVNLPSALTLTREDVRRSCEAFKICFNI